MARSIDWIIFSVSCVIAGLTSHVIFAGQDLEKREIIRLLSGNIANGYFMKEGEQAGHVGRVGLKIQFHKNGSAEKTTIPAKTSKGQFVETGKWWVNKAGRLCLSWDQENKKRCGKLKRIEGGKYVLRRKSQHVVFEEITSGR
jgi:hypothetical protein